MTTVRLDQRAIEEWASNEEAEALLDRVGELIANDARDAAPKRTGAMADSITHEIVRDSGGLSVRVSWDSEHFYGIFAELGTSKETARPFLRPAALKHRSL